ncbi:M23 family metallopeptidase [Streptomyces sp. ODS28]|uniref:M23 family metallopeptidase n=1 Tax=Streptomyces sp. ODS28 TaxID=3136688 RepID=UPI0031E65023
MKSDTTGAPRSRSLRKATETASRVFLLIYLAMIVATFFTDDVPLWATWFPLGLWLLSGYGVSRMARTADERAAGPAHAGTEVAAPVTGRWKAQNSPADKVPSHGTRAYGQAYAIDIVAEPSEGSRPGFGWWPLTRRCADFPAYGAEVLAVAEATVVHVEDGQRDHLSRTSWLSLTYLLMIESLVRAVGGARRVIGNHVVLDLGDDTYALYAHLSPGTLKVQPGDRVRAGHPIALCGNSGNSTEPHLHFQLMDTPDPNTASGIPFTWTGVGVPKSGELFEAGTAEKAVERVPAPGA